MLNASVLRLSLAVCLTLVAVGAALAAEKPLVSSGTEVSTPGGRRPPPAVTAFVLKQLSADDRSDLKDCLAEKRLGRSDYAALLTAIPVKAGGDRTLWFVRPALEPYCHSLYGAHIYRYFLVEQKIGVSRLRLLYADGGDEFSIYRRQSHGLNDIEASGCIVDGCRTARMAWNGRRYRPTLCTRNFFTGDGKEIVKRRRCGSDDWSDAQASGLNPKDHP